MDHTMNPIRIAFVCLGNICRSPTAEATFRVALARAKVTHRFHVESAGTGDWHVGGCADPRTVKAAKTRGVDLSRHRAQQFTAKDFARFDHVIAMDRANVSNLMAMAPNDEAKKKIRLMRSFVADASPDAEVPDPYYGGEDGFDHVLDLCEAASEALLASLLTREP